ncbi:MAG TPA: hypothetical protein VGL61_34845 [Kofleriaceae bacterium]
MWRGGLVAVMLAAAASPAHAQIATDDDVTRTSGLAVALSLGYESPLFGGQLDYYVTSPTRPFGLAGYLGMGWYPGITVDNTPTGGSLGLAFGALGFWGRRHRAVVDLGYGAGALEAQAGAGTILRQDMLYGLTLAGGYEYMNPIGLFVRATVGGTWLTGDIYVANQSRVQPTLSLVVGVKIL